MKAIDLIRYIVWVATQKDIRLTTVRLVKFVYLADLYYARVHGGETLTNFPWAFVHYGPYCSEVMRDIDRAASAGMICKRSYESHFGEGKEYHLFTCDDPEAENIESHLPAKVWAPLKNAIRRYGDDTASLLDYVYFETELMCDVKKGDMLDFSKAKRPERAKPCELKKIPEAKIELAKKHAKALREKLRHRREVLEAESKQNSTWNDEVFEEALELMNEQDLETGLGGIADIVQ